MHLQLPTVLLSMVVCLSCGMQVGVKPASDTSTDDLDSRPDSPDIHPDSPLDPIDIHDPHDTVLDPGPHDVVSDGVDIADLPDTILDPVALDAEDVEELYDETDPPPCTGTQLDGFCWHLGAEEDGCDDTCAGHGGYHPATRTFAGSGGTSSNCDRVLDALGLPGPGTTDELRASGVGVGCFYMNLVNQRYWVQDVATSDTATYIRARRACACVY